MLVVMAAIALARKTGEPLLSRADFRRTDVVPAVPASDRVCGTGQPG